MKLKKIFAACLSFFILSSSFLYAADQSSAAAFYTQGCSAFFRGEWDSAVFLLRKTVADKDYNTEDANYMLITAEIYSGDVKAALADCEDFLISYPKSRYFSRIQYTRGKLLFTLGEYDKAIITLSDFCHNNEKSELYPSALFYMAESFYAGFNYDVAESLYENIINNYPDSEKYAAAQYRMESIAQRSREEKLLYLLKQTGEEYLSAKEDYEKQLRLTNSDSVTRERLVEYQQKNKELEEMIQDLEVQIQEMKVLQAQKDAQIAQKEAEEEQRKKDAEIMANVQKKNNEEVLRLKQKALLIEQLLVQEGGK